MPMKPLRFQAPLSPQPRNRLDPLCHSGTPWPTRSNPQAPFRPLRSSLPAHRRPLPAAPVRPGGDRWDHQASSTRGGLPRLPLQRQLRRRRLRSHQRRGPSHQQCLSQCSAAGRIRGQTNPRCNRSQTRHARSGRPVQLMPPSLQGAARPPFFALQPTHSVRPISLQRPWPMTTRSIGIRQHRCRRGVYERWGS